jgi:hypothetical protein
LNKTWMGLGILGIVVGVLAWSSMSAMDQGDRRAMLEPVDPVPGAASDALPDAATEPAPPSAELPVELLPSPAADGSSQPSLSRGRNGTVLMIWMERSADGMRFLKFARYDGSGWSEPNLVASAPNLIANAADIPSILELPSGRLVAQWQQAATTGRGSYGVRVAQSIDGGASWSRPVVPHVSQEVGENGFVSLYAAGADSAGVIWLDGRGYAAPAAGGGAAMLMTTRIAPNGGIAPEKQLDERVCDCCNTAYAPTTSGGILAYRDRSPTNVRDIAIVRHRAGTWGAPSQLHADGWVTPSCPVNGPSVDAIAEATAVAWFTNASGTARVYVSFSADAESAFTRPVQVDAGDPLGRPKVVLTQPSVAWVAWVERSGSTAQVMVRRVSPDGTRSEPLVFAPRETTSASGFPQMVAQGSELILAWTTPASPTEPPRIRVARAGTSDR